MLLGMLKAWLSLLRTIYPMMAYSQVIIGAAIVGEQLTFDLFLQALFVIPTIASSNALNDFFDLPSDRALGRADRPLVSGKITPNQALAASALLLITGLALCLYLAAFLIVATAIVVILGVAYNAFLKRMPLVGNIIIGFSYALPLIYGNALADQSLNSLRPVIILLASLTFLTGFGRELMGTVKDMEGDRKLNAVSLPMLVGVRPVVTSVTTLSIALAALSPLPLLFLFSIPYAVLIGASGAIRLACAYSAFKDSSYSNLQRLANYHTSALLLGLLAFATLPLTTQPPWN
jgi:geranylgeranylglycerol-phosphate geranylgeranyltransferase